MGEWLATVRFENGNIRYARYSTVVESVLSGLYMSVCHDGPRARPAGEPIAGRPGDPPAAVEDLVAVVITVDPDELTWHAVYDPARDLLVGPRSSHHRAALREEYHLIGGHLTKGPRLGLCGRAADGDEVPFHRPHWLDHAHLDAPPPGSDLPEIDLFAGWAGGTVCRDCLMATI
ncbi:hypothetical protein [Actinoplanes subtropicus]|uniref:hypothetical protein n=1 Tax=Actinoplanes subtropicus TaxID=543632 RepID=UPI0004C2F58E|nr:hypothetical protein [Actinoplanes subtropicus]